MTNRENEQVGSYWLNVLSIDVFFFIYVRAYTLIVILSALILVNKDICQSLVY